MMVSHLPHLAALEFVSLPMLGWLAAAALPWLIYRFYRRQHHTTPWAAVDLLLGAMRQRSRQIQIQQWLLLAVRTAILVLVALAVAEPAWNTRTGGVSGAVKTHQILVIDQSYSMGYRQQETSRWKRAVAQSREWIESSEGDAWTLIGWSQQAENRLGRPTRDRLIMLAALDELQLSQASANLAAVLRAILAAVDRAQVDMPELANHQVVFCTDLGRQTWTFSDETRGLLKEVANRAGVTLINVAEDETAGEQPCNVAITDLTIDPAITLLQHESAVTATLGCFGQPLSRDVWVELMVGSRRVGQQKVEWNAEGVATARFTHRFIEEGAQTVRAVLTNHDDGLPCDDTRWLTVDVRPRLRVACFSGQPGVADDLARALAPGRYENKHGESIETMVLPVDRLGELDLSTYSAVVLSSVQELSSREADRVVEYVRQGGGLAVFLGQNASLKPLASWQDLLPVQILALKKLGEYRLDPRAYRHSILSPFRGQNQAGLLGVTVSQYWQLRPRDNRPEMEVVLDFDTGDPALLVDRFGLGRIAVMALPGSLAVRTAEGTPWSSFALNPSFLPVIRELVTYLVGDRWLQQRNVLVGETVVFPWAASAKTAKVRLPAGTSRALPLLGAEDLGQRSFRATEEQGIYRFSRDGQECARFAVNLDGRDSDLASIDRVELPVFFSGQIAEGLESFSETSQGKSFARTLLIVALVLLLAEIGLAWMLGRGWR